MSLQWYPGHMTKARREMIALMPSQDVMIEVLDSRLPKASSNPLLAEVRGSKPVIKVLTKSDLADPAVTRAWVEYFEGEPDVKAFAATTARPQVTRSRIAELCRGLALHRGADKPVRALIAGVPNVGKSTLLNTLMNRAVAKVGDKPAVTKEQQLVHLANGMVVTDSPGMMWPKVEHEPHAFRLAFAGSIPDTAIDYLEIGMFGAAFLLERYPALTVARYKLAATPPSAEALLMEVGRRRGALRKGGVIDLHKAAEMLVHEFRGGVIGPISLEAPPTDTRQLQPSERDLAALQGRWEQTALEVDGVVDPADSYGADLQTTFEGRRFTVFAPDGSIVLAGGFTLDASTKSIDWVDSMGEDAGKTLPAIYELTGDHFRFIAGDEGQRPTEFRTKPGQTMRTFGGYCPRVPDPDRPELVELRARITATLDEARPEAVARRRKTGQRTARENIADLVDEDSFSEYGGLALAAQHARHSIAELITASPADGLIAGTATVGGDRVMVLAYDYAVFAGTQGGMSHKKLDRMLGLAKQWKLPVVLFAEGGGGRPNDTDMPLVAGLDTSSFHAFAALGGLVPRIGIVSGRCFAGNAALLGLCDVVIATDNSSIGMGGPAMIEGGGLGVFKPEEVGPIDMQVKSGVVDVRVADEPAAIVVAKKYLRYFTRDGVEGECVDQDVLRTLIPAERRRAYKVRPVIEALADIGSVLELRAEFGLAAVTALVRIDGAPFGLIANSSQQLGGALDSDACDKLARFLQLCDVFGLPILSLCDTPGFMVGPKAEATGLVRHAARLFAISASLSVPFFTIILRRGYGLGAQAMSGGHFHASAFTISWPSGEFGAMGLEGAVKLSLRKQLEALPDDAARDALVAKHVAVAYERGKAISMASYLEIDGVIDPADTRAWITRGLVAMPVPTDRPRRFLDTW